MAFESFLSFLMGLHEYASIRVWTVHYCIHGSGRWFGLLLELFYLGRQNITSCDEWDKACES